MRPTDYSQPGSAAAEALVADLFALGKIGYVALGSSQEVLMRPARGLVTDTTPTSNFFEELLVNPTLLKLAGQRGRLDCNGLRYIAIGYEGFIQFVMPMRDGHVSLGVADSRDTKLLAEQVQAVLTAHGRAHVEPQPALLA